VAQEADALRVLHLLPLAFALLVLVDGGGGAEVDALVEHLVFAGREAETFLGAELADRIRDRADAERDQRDRGAVALACPPEVGAGLGLLRRRVRLSGVEAERADDLVEYLRDAGEQLRVGMIRRARFHLLETEREQPVAVVRHELMKGRVFRRFDHRASSTRSDLRRGLSRPLEVRGTREM